MKNNDIKMFHTGSSDESRILIKELQEAVRILKQKVRNLEEHLDLVDTDEPL